jgi:hypothetical protein
MQPDREDELARIEAAGGKVINWNGHRIFGVLAMSRALGKLFLLSLVCYYFYVHLIRCLVIG